MARAYTVYVIGSPFTCKRYIGVTNDAQARLRMHKHRCGRGTVHPLYAAMRKHGFDSFWLRELAQFEDRAAAAEYERLAIQAIGKDRLYNLADGGDINGGFKRSEDQRRRHSDFMRLRFANPVERLRNLQTSVAAMRRAKSDETEAKRISRLRSVDVRRRVAASLKQYFQKHPEAVAKMRSERQVRVYRTPTGEFPSLKSAARALGCTPKTVRDRCLSRSTRFAAWSCEDLR